MGFIYKITNIENDKSYIGQTDRFNPYERWDEHKKMALNSKNTSHPLYIDMKENIDHFIFNLIEETDNINEREKYFIRHYNTLGVNGYNLNEGGDNPNLYEIPAVSDEKIIHTYFLYNRNLNKTAVKYSTQKEYIKNILEKNNIKSYNSADDSDFIKKKFGRRFVNNYGSISQFDSETGELLNVFDSVKQACNWLVDNGFTKIDPNGIAPNIIRSAKKGIKCYGFVFSCDNL